VRDVPVIDPVPKGSTQPLWSVMIPTYNCAAHLQETLESVLACGVSPDEMRIEVVDDCSTLDDPAAVVNAVGGSRVGFHRQPENVGPTRNFNTCIERSRGRLVHILHGDDFVQPSFYTEVTRAFERWPDVAGVFTRCFIIDEWAELESLSDRLSNAEREPTRDASWIYYHNPICTPGVVIRRSFYEAHGGFLPELVHTADWEMWLRLITRGGAVALNEPLASYRVFDASHSGQLRRTGENVVDHLRLGDVLAGADLAGFDAREFRDNIAWMAIEQSLELSRRGDAEAARANRRVFDECARPSVKVKAALRRLGRLLPG
jgi:glycosyltransferase involved in cell wall biosynthesis